MMTDERQFDPRRRLLGAVVMVVAAIILLPIILQAPAPHHVGEDVLTVTRQGPQVQTVWQPASAAANTPASAPVPPVVPPVAAPSSAPPPPALSPAVATPSRWLVQVGAYINAADAIALMQRLRAQGFPAHVRLVQFAHGHGLVVTVGPYDAGHAQAARTAVAGRDHIEGLVVPAPS
ncbi:MAG: SPOR domain-containing protein [Acidiferrobacter sp.]